MIGAVLLVILAVFIPPIPVLILAGCGLDFLISIILTFLGFIPGHIYAFYVIYVYYHRRDAARRGVYSNRQAPLIFSRKVQTGGFGYQMNRQSAPPPQRGPQPPYGPQPQYPAQPVYA